MSERRYLCGRDKGHLQWSALFQKFYYRLHTTSEDRPRLPELSVRGVVYRLKWLPERWIPCEPRQSQSLLLLAVDHSNRFHSVKLKSELGSNNPPGSKTTTKC